ncbi:MAG: acyltransferase family protein [Pseudomonas sp.]|uniref:acyltransferase family protein n=1 Tax=Pseudomonas sp. TaxID=306 RepID=UPI003394C7C7
MKKIYNPEIDGLRSVAVLSVIFFHFGVAGFSGGFVGVDVFFVISGFLISRLIFSEVERGAFSYSRFFRRRVRRLFPALFATLVGTFFCGALVLAPEDLEKLSGSLVYSVFSLSNIFFWQQSGYFDTDATLKPLLHTWSLGVEEQFYLIWPVCIVLLYKTLGRKSFPVLMALAGVASLLACERVLSSSPSAAYYLMPLRVFEFVVGALLFWSQSLHALPARAKAALGVFGIVMIGYAIYAFNELTRFPGANALVPCVGAALVIYAGQEGVVGRVLASRVCVGVGLISYSLYLTHWPLVVFYKYITDQQLRLAEQLGLLVATFGLSLILYFWVERPFRQVQRGWKILGVSTFGVGVAVFSLMIILPAAHAWANKGWAWRFKDGEQFLTRYDINNLKYVWARWEALPPNNVVGPGKRNVYLLGDSQAADMLNVIESSSVLAANNAEVTVYHIPFMCGAVVVDAEKLERFYAIENKIFLETKTARKDCEVPRAEGFAVERLKTADLIILSPYWWEYLVGYLPATIEKIRESSTAPIIVVGQKHMLASSTSIFMKHQTLNGIEWAARHFIDPKSVRVNSELQKSAGKNNVYFFNPLDIICQAAMGCKVFGSEGGPIMYDTHHLTPEGAAFVASSFSEWLLRNISLAEKSVSER